MYKLKGPDALSRKGCNEDDVGNMEIPTPKREPIWFSEFDSEIARKSLDDNFWLSLVIKKFNENDRLSTAQVLEVTRSKRKID